MIYILGSAKVPLCVTQTHFHQIMFWSLYAFQKFQWHYWKQLWPLVFFCRLIAFVRRCCSFILTCDQAYGFYITVWDREAWLSICPNRNLVQKCEGNILTWDNSINQKWKDSFISTKVFFLAALCRNNYDVFCTSSQYITVCMRFTKGDESKRKECAKRQLQSRWAGRDILIWLNLTKIMQLYEWRQEIFYMYVL